MLYSHWNTFLYFELKFEFTKKKNVLFSFSPLDCLLPAQQYHGPGPILCHIFQVNKPHISHLDNVDYFELLFKV